MAHQTLFDLNPRPIFHGADFEPQHDQARLERQQDRIIAFMRDGRWSSLRAIAAGTGDPEGSISAQLRAIDAAGIWRKERRVEGDRSQGLYSYRLTRVEGM